jgi:hypothetical protein
MDPTASMVVHARDTPASRKLQKVPFVELYGGRLQGVVSSGSSASRVYVSAIEAQSTDFSCATNNNRPCGGLRGGPCKHLQALVDNAVAQYGAPRVARALQLADPDACSSTRDILARIVGSSKKLDASEVFSRFLAYLRYVELPPGQQPLPELSWFLTG